jgi:4-amino-4-deoxy-L-arabinose transferase-like glycosyltransferase
MLGLVQLLALAPWMGEDEPWHVEYASHVAAGYRPWGGQPMRGPPLSAVDDRVHMPLAQLQVRRRFADIPAERIAETQEEILRSMTARHYYQRVDWVGVEPQRSNFDQVAPDFSATTQPPVYYLLGGGLLALLSIEDVEAQMWALRGLSWLLYLAGVAAALGFARCLFEDESLALSAAALFAFLPMSARQAAVVNNDVLAKFLVAVVLLVAARWLTGKARRWEPALALVLCLLGLMSKPTAASAAIALLAVPFLRSRRLADRGRRLVFVIGLLLVAAVAGYFWLNQHNAALPRSLVGLRTRLQVGFSAETYVTIGRTLVGSFGWESRFLPDGFVLGVLAVGALGLVLAVRALLSRSTPASRPLLLLCLLVVGVQIAMVVLRGAARGRYLVPALPAASALIVTGLLASWPADTRRRAIQLFALALVALEAVFLWGGLLFQEHLRWSL